MDGNPKRIKKDAFSKISGYVWTGPEIIPDVLKKARDLNDSTDVSFALIRRLEI